MARRKKTERQKLEGRIWELCKKIIRHRYKRKDGTWLCYTSGHTLDSPRNCQTGHGKPKGALPLRYKYDLRNLKPQCMRCNMHHGGMTDIFIKKLEREKSGLKFLEEACRKTKEGWVIKKDQTMGSLEAEMFLRDLEEKYKKILQKYE